MPKLTRDEMFQRAMAEFLQTVEVKLANGEIKTFHIQTYTLTNKTENRTKVSVLDTLWCKKVGCQYGNRSQHLFPVQ